MGYQTELSGMFTYATFWDRFSAIIMDGVFIFPVLFLVLFLFKHHSLYIALASLPVYFIYSVWMVKQYGGSPGKLLLGIKIIRTDGEVVGWREAILRESVSLLLLIIKIIFLAFVATRQEVTLHNSPFLRYYQYISSSWLMSEVLIMLTNRQRRAIHDFIAGTVVVKKARLLKI